jgi:hypothetical protein
LIDINPKTVLRAHPPDNQDTRLEMNTIAEKWRQFGDRRTGVMLERVGMVLDGTYAPVKDVMLEF